MGILIKGKELADEIKQEIKEEVSRLKSKPGIAVVIVGDDPASKIYVSKKNKTAVEVGMNSSIIELNRNISQLDLEKVLEKLNKDDKIDAILVQLPLPGHINTYDIIQKIDTYKDVDGFHPENVGRLSAGLEPYAVPCTPYGIIKLLEENNIQIQGKKAVVIGRSNIVGKPMSMLLLNRNATVCICHSKTSDLKEIASSADILVSAIGKPKLINKDFVKDGAVVIDVGINRTEQGKLIGDVDFENVESKASYITPVPGGVGPMTIAMLLNNTLRLHKLRSYLVS